MRFCLRQFYRWLLARTTRVDAARRFLFLPEFDANSLQHKRRRVAFVELRRLDSASSQGRS